MYICSVSIDLEPTTVSDWSFDENCLFCCLRRDKVKVRFLVFSFFLTLVVILFCYLDALTVTDKSTCDVRESTKDLKL